MEKKKGRQVIALVAIILLAALYVATLVAAFVDRSASATMFRLCLICTILVPLAAWLCIWMYGRTSGKRTIADLNLMQDPEDVRKAHEEDQKKEVSRISHRPGGEKTLREIAGTADEKDE